MDLNKTTKKNVKMLQSSQRRNESNSTKNDIISKLPLEIAQDIFLRLSPRSLLEIWKINQNWRFIMNGPYFWKRKCLKDNFIITDCSLKSKVFQNILQEFDYWHAIYIYNQELNYNWKNKICYITNMRSELFYKEIHSFDDEKVILSTCNNDLVIFDYLSRSFDTIVRLEEFEKMKRIKIHFNLLICISITENIYVWNITTKECIYRSPWELSRYLVEVEVYNNSILAIVDSNRVFSTINIESKVVSSILEEIDTIKLYKNFAVLQTNFSEVTILNMDDNSVSKFNCSEEQNVIVEMISKDNYLICFYENKTISTWDIETQAKLISFKFTGLMKTSNVERLMLLDDIELLNNDKFVYITYFSDSIHIWNFLTGTSVMTINTNNITVDHVHVTARYLFVTFFRYDYVKVLCSQTGNLIATVYWNVCFNEYGDLLVTESKLLGLMDTDRYQSIEDLIIFDYEMPITIP